MDNIQKESRKIRQKIRNEAKKLRISTDEYRAQNNITKETIKKWAREKYNLPTTEIPNIKEEYKIPYDGFSNKPKYPSLQMDKPFLRIAHSKLHGFDFLVYLADNGHYLTKDKIYRPDSGEASRILSI